MKDSPQTADPHDLPQSHLPEGNWFVAIRAVAGFQLNRLMTRPRLAMGLAGAFFPAAVMFAVIRTAPIDRNMTVVMIYALIPEALCVLGLLVAMCPIVADELERGTWIHVTVRPGGRQSLLLGTFAAAILWTDPKSEWLPIIAAMQAELGELLVLGDYVPEAHTGPAI